MNIKLKGTKNVYEEIAEQYKAYISLGVVDAGEKLPSCRELAIELGINPNTVERAYSLLESEGFVYTIPKKGVFVNEKTNNKALLIAETKKHILAICQSGLSKDELIKIADEVYKENKDK